MADTALWTGIASSLFFVVLNVAMNVYTKFLFTEQFSPWTMLAIQQFHTFMVLYPATRYMKYQGWDKLSDHEDPKDAEIRLVHVCEVCLVTVLFCLNVGLNSLSLVAMSITLNQTVRAFLPVGVLVLGFCFETRPYHPSLYVTTSVVVLGIAITCWGSPEFHWYGFSLAFASTLVAAVGTSLNGKLLNNGPFGKTGPYGVAFLVLVQSVPAAFIFSAVAYVSESQGAVEKFSFSATRTSSPEQCLMNLLLVTFSSLLALLSNLGRCFLVAATSPLTETLAGNAKVAALCIIDSLLFGTRLHWWNYVGITLTFSGFSLHLLLQYASKNSKSMPQSPKMAFNRPRLISAADTGLAAELLAFDSRESKPLRRIGENSLKPIPELPRPRSVTWPQPVPSSASMWAGLDFSNIFDVPVWLKLGYSVVPKDYSPISTAGSSPARRSGPSSRSRFYSDPTDTTNSRAHRLEDVRLGDGVDEVEEEEMKRTLPSDVRLGNHFLQAGEEKAMKMEVEFRGAVDFDDPTDFGYL